MKHESNRLAALIRRFTVERFDVSGVDTLGRTALHYASELGNLELVRALLDKGAEVNAQDNEGCTPLLLAARFNFTGVCKELIVVRSADFKLVDNNMKSALYYASLNKNFALIKIILQKREATEVSIAEFVDGYYRNQNPQEHVRLLSDIVFIPWNRFNVNAKDNSGLTALHYAAQIAPPSVINQLVAMGAKISMETDLQGPSQIIFAS